MGNPGQGHADLPAVQKWEGASRLGMPFRNSAWIQRVPTVKSWESVIPVS